MSWEAATLIALALLFLVVISWYELSRPSSKQVAMIATMAALAVVGRLVFAPLPNVKPTTDLVFFTGFAFGGLPGLITGSLAAFASNFFFGHGPWTPWQMLGWGLVGGFGALAAYLSKGQLGRLPLALLCLFAGLIFGVVMNFQTWLVFTGAHSAESFMRVTATSFWFDLAHMVGNFLLALAFGPALLRVLNRYRRRFEVTWRPQKAVALKQLSVFLLAVVVAVSSAQPASASTISDGLDYLRSTQNSDGGFGGSKDESSAQIYSGWAALGIVSAGENPAGFKKDGKSVIDYVRDNLKSIDDLGELERTVMVLSGAGVSPRSFGGRNLLKEILSKQRQNGSFQNQSNFTAFAIFALRASGKQNSSTAVRRAAAWLASKQQADGGFSFAAKGASSVDMTGAVLQALAAADRKSGKVVNRAVKYLSKARNPNGGYGEFPDSASNGQSTAWAVQGLVAAKRDVSTELAFLRSLQQQNGSFRYSRTSEQTPVWVTAQVLPALAKRPFPLAEVKTVKREVAGKLSLPVALAVAAGTATLFIGAHRRRARRH